MSYSVSRKSLFTISTKVFPVGSASFTLISSGLYFAFVWYRNCGFSQRIIFFTYSATWWEVCIVLPNIETILPAKVPRSSWLFWSASDKLNLLTKAVPFSGPRVCVGPGSSMVHLQGEVTNINMAFFLAWIRSSRNKAKIEKRQKGLKSDFKKSWNGLRT